VKLSLGYYTHAEGHGNFGDEISSFIVSQVSGMKTALPADANHPKIVAIGSLLHNNWIKDQDLVWGSGIMHHIIHNKPQVVAVRGPLTRQFLLGCEISCPKVYGDPALLLNRYYQPEIIPELQDKIVVVPHWSQYDELQDLSEELEIFYDAVVINPTDNWQTVVNQIASAKAVVSSSLHGLIVADSYSRPNIWLNVGSLVGHKGDLKFRDYLLSQNRPITSIDSIEKIDSAEYYQSGNQIDLDVLVKAFPSDISEYLIR